VAPGAAGAYAGDIVTYAFCLWGGERLARRLHWLRDKESVTHLGDRLRDRQMLVLLVPD
jgi:hypothetical protein